MLADAGTVALIVVVVLLATLLPMYAKWRAMQALLDRLTRHAQPRPHQRGDPPTPAGSAEPKEPVTDSSDEAHEPTTRQWKSS